jgi:hypothetical protein
MITQVHAYAKYSLRDRGDYRQLYVSGLQAVHNSRCPVLLARRLFADLDDI